jgi:hypothetical protein
MKTQVYITQIHESDDGLSVVPIPISNTTIVVAEAEHINMKLLHVSYTDEEKEKHHDSISKWTGFLLLDSSVGVASPIKTLSDAYRTYVSLSKRYWDHDTFIKRSGVKLPTGKVNIAELTFNFKDQAKAASIKKSEALQEEQIEEDIEEPTKEEG